jgi:hypothetical protein
LRVDACFRTKSDERTKRTRNILYDARALGYLARVGGAFQGPPSRYSKTARRSTIPTREPLKAHFHRPPASRMNHFKPLLFCVFLRGALYRCHGPKRSSGSCTFNRTRKSGLPNIGAGGAVKS